MSKIEFARLLLSVAEQAVPLPLIDGETSSQFMKTASAYIPGYIKEKFGGDENEVKASLCDATGEAIIINLWGEMQERYFDTYISVAYTRGEDGSFMLGEWTEVRKLVSFVPVLAGTGLLGESTLPMSPIEQVASLAAHGNESAAQAVIEQIAALTLQRRARIVGHRVGPISEAAGARWYVGDPESLSTAMPKLQAAGATAVIQREQDAIIARAQQAERR